MDQGKSEVGAVMLVGQIIWQGVPKTAEFMALAEFLLTWGHLRFLSNQTPLSSWGFSSAGGTLWDKGSYPGTSGHILQGHGSKHERFDFP